MRVLVTGDSRFALPAGTRVDGRVTTNVEAATHYAIVCAALESLDPAVVIHGDAMGADMAAGRWAEARGIPTISCPADWDALGAEEGGRQNQAMLDGHKPDIVLAFPGGVRTDDMVLRAQLAAVPVRLALRRASRSQGRLF